MNKTQEAEIKTQDKLREFINREIFVCQTNLVEELLKKEVFFIDDIENLYFYRIEKMDDGYEDFLTEEQMENLKEDIKDEIGQEKLNENRRKKLNDYITYLEKLGTEPQEIYEWYVVSRWFGEKLREKGEPILDNDLGLWWGRTCFGQAVYMDGVVKKIASEESI